jgi:hypothetical protein
MRTISGLLAFALLLQAVPPAFAQTAADSTATARPASLPSVDSAISQAKELLRDADYDRSIEVLKQALTVTRTSVDRKREIYLLLIKTYVFLGNDLKFRPQGRAASSLNYQEAKRLIGECLRTRELRHTRCEPVSEYPPEMVAFFAEVRREIFGAYRVLHMDPRWAIAKLDGDTLRSFPGDTLLGDVDIQVGPHEVLVRALGFKDLTDRIQIAPDITLERSYKLERQHGPLWYASRWGAAVGVVGGTIAAFAAKGGNKGTTLAPLPGAPPPPSSP